MGLHLVTGYAGYQHVTAADQGAFNSALLLSGNYVLSSGSKFAASVITNNSIKISDGDLIMQGRHVRLKPGEVVEVAIENGTQDYKRNDLIVARYVKDGTTGVENVSFVVIQGTPDISTASDPAYIEGNILNGVLTADFPLYRVPLNGLNIGDLVALFEVKDSFDERIKDLIADVKDGSIVAGNASGLGGESASAWQTKLDNIQTTSRATLSTAGWYRVAKVTGAAGSTVILKVGNVYAHSGSDEHLLLFTYSYDNAKFSTISSKATNAAPIFSKARYTVEGTNSYLEVYFSVNTEEPVNCTVLSFPDWYGNSWKALDFIATSETVSGVTVTTTYNILANASPVTDLDLVLAESSTKKLGSVTSLSELDNYYGVNGYIEVNIAGSYAKVFALTFSNAENLQIMSYSFNSVLKFRKAYFNSSNIRVWTDWHEYATTSDLTTALANYAHRGGANFYGDINLSISDTSKYIRYRLQNSLRDMEIGLTQTGDFVIYDNTHRVTIARSVAGSTTTFNGTATGNLPLTGGTIGTGIYDVPIRVRGTNISLIDFRNTDHAFLGRLGFNQNKELVNVMEDWTQQPILHSGNFTDYTIAKDGGGEINGYTQITHNHDIPFVVQNTNASQDTAYVGFKDSAGTLIGWVGYKGKQLTAYDRVSNANKEIHHDGNSAKVAIQETAPTDTSALWVY